MHEMSLAEGILQIVQDQAGNSPRVHSVTLSVGELAGVELDALRFCFDVVTRDSAAQDAILEIETVPGSAFCFDCLAQVPLARRGNPCPRCEGHSLTVVGGDQMKVKYLEID
ncbi:hydrogenase nickel insertion protein HypA [Ferrimonas balearica DSM 9799]|uniref:Hydrogenase maturation factor HypA n=1 Tax=Ferrimonas balearica (strain DSM 9799 / CCM 4581 / KCTC 23876 / PAT) TaxID=550540 RepID=E1SV50_FERBD|nr:hydrogenase maturation nickel metallochaperone HypA [Ferrimonas balearica]ADN77350.1 hydrogenase nickel insertion protein HypA [Ferrimonas balearica DSM 9799]MBW3164686.1 hydrogenase maturation nickel metallochaperone HypA [Ferrimonas balearica]MBY5980452.1 hydrogenase maturation nickel metallochaperone HypA [Ferrimonas balearica]MBY6224212.1 hydrogenase maturation nickel metallochaperone HypA [Ferrimonas balearica]